MWKSLCRWANRSVFLFSSLSLVTFYQQFSTIKWDRLYCREYPSFRHRLESIQLSRFDCSICVKLNDFLTNISNNLKSRPIDTLLIEYFVTLNVRNATEKIAFALASECISINVMWNIALIRCRRCTVIATNGLIIASHCFFPRLIVVNAQRARRVSQELTELAGMSEKKDKVTLNRFKAHHIMLSRSAATKNLMQQMRHRWRHQQCHPT